ncbi:glycosyltransferase family 4 protein [bacterium]|nr:glycosyltransferase family 4 protein [bacterium]
MRILIVSQYFWPEQFRVNDLVEELCKRGHEITVLTGKPNYPCGTVYEEYRRNTACFNHYKGAQIIRVPLAVRGSTSFQLVFNYLSFFLSASLFGVWRLRGIQFDSVFVFGTSPITACLPAILLGKLKKAKVVLWVLDLWPDTLQALGVVKSKFILFLVGVLVKFIYRHCDLVLGQSKAFIQSIRRYQPDVDKIKFFPNWAEDIFDSSLAEMAPELDKRLDKFNIVFAGNLGDAQDLPNVLDAAKILQKKGLVRWIFLGEGRRSDWLKKEIMQNNLADDCLVLGSYPVSRMPSFFAHADALLVSLKNEPVFSSTIPGKVQSYLQSGKPVLGMINGEGARVIDEAEAGMACPAGDSSALANNIISMASLCPDKREVLGLNGMRYAQEEFNRTKLINQLEIWLRK